MDDDCLTPFGKVAHRLAGLTLLEVGDLMRTDPEVSAAVDWLLEQAREQLPENGCC